MGRRGPQPTATKILEMRGSWRASLRGKEPKAPKGTPRRPRTLRKDAVRCWKRLMPQLEKMGVLSIIDREALARYCQAVAAYWEAERVLDHEGSTYKTYDQNGNAIIRDRPEVARSSKLSEECRKLENLFGLNPSARAALATPKESDPLENRGKSRFFSGGIA